MAAKTAARKRPARKTAGKAPAPKPRAPAKKVTSKLSERFEADSARVVEAHAKHKGDWAKIAKATGMSQLKAQRMYTRATLKPSDRLYTKGLTDDELGKAIVELRDNQGLKVLPDVWARTGLSVDRIKALYAQHTKGTR